MSETSNELSESAVQADAAGRGELLAMTGAERTPGPAADTSAEAVRRSVHFLLHSGWLIGPNSKPISEALEAAAQIDALAAERDAARKEVWTYRDAYLTACSRASAAECRLDEATNEGAIAGLGVAAVLAADAAQAAREDARYRVLATSRARDLGAADALARLCDQIGEEIKRRG